MQLDEETRRHVFSTLVEKLDETTAVVLMNAIPPVPWSEFATKADLHSLEDRLSGRMYRALLIQAMGLFAGNIALVSAFAR